MVDLVARGDQRHAGYAADDGEFTQCRARARPRPAPARAISSRPAASRPGPHDGHPHHGRGRGQPERHAAGRAGGARRAEHARLDPRGARARCCERRSDARSWSPPTAWCPARRRPAPVCSPPRGGSGRRRRRSAVPPAPTGCSCATPTPSSAGPAPAGARTPPTSTWTCPKSLRRDAFYADVVPSLPGGALMASAQADDALDRRARAARRRDVLDYTAAETGPGMRGCCAGTSSAAWVTSKALRASRLLTGAEYQPAPPGTASGAGGGGRRPRCRWAPTRGRPHRGRGLAHPPAPGQRGTAAHRPLAQRPGRLRPAALSEGPPARGCTRRRSTLADSAAPVRRAAPPTRSGPGTPTSAARCRRRSGSGPAAYAEGHARHGGGAALALGERGSVAAGERRGLRCAAAAPARGRRACARLRPGWSTTSPRCRPDAASSRRPCCSGARSSATSSRGSRRT